MVTVQASETVPIAPALVRKETNLWTDAFSRLIRNRAAVLGGVIILGLFLVYVFAPLIAPKPFDVQINADNKHHAELVGRAVSHHPRLCPHQQQLFIGRG